MKSCLRKFAKPRSLPVDSNSAAPVATTLKLVNPVENYYRHKIKTNLPVFYRFALQTRSLMIRDVFAKAASKRGYDLTDLLAVLTAHASTDLDDESKASIAEVFDSEVLLTLANLLANTARDDLDTHKIGRASCRERGEVKEVAVSEKKKEKWSIDGRSIDR